MESSRSSYKSSFLIPSFVSFHNTGLESFSDSGTGGSYFRNVIFMWNSRLGHDNFNVIKIVLSKCQIHIPNKCKFDFCNSCGLGKSHRLYAPLSLTIYKFTFDVVHTDLWGPTSYSSSCGYNYYISFVISYRKYTWIYLLRQKPNFGDLWGPTSYPSSCGYNYYIFFLVSYRRYTWIYLLKKSLILGGEFRPFTWYLVELGISHELTCPRTSHQKGIVKRKYRNIMEMSLTFLAQAFINLSFLDRSFTTSNYVINMLRAFSLSEFSSPFHYLYKTLRVFDLFILPLRATRISQWESNIYIASDEGKDFLMGVQHLYKISIVLNLCEYDTSQLLREFIYWLTKRLSPY